MKEIIFYNKIVYRMTDLAIAKANDNNDKNSVSGQLDENKKTEPQLKEANSNILRRDNEEYKIIKKLPQRFPKSPNDIYITNKTDFKAQYEKCKHLLANFNDTDHIVLHSMGPSINR